MSPGLFDVDMKLLYQLFCDQMKYHNTIIHMSNISYNFVDSFRQISGLCLASFITLLLIRFLFMVCDISHVKSALVNCFYHPEEKSLQSR